MPIEMPLTNSDSDLMGLRAAAVDASPELRGLLAHHINNALTVVIGNLDYLRECALATMASNDTVEALDDALRSARKIVTVIEMVCLKTEVPR
jgi:hypothetical protein